MGVWGRVQLFRFAFSVFWVICDDLGVSLLELWGLFSFTFVVFFVLLITFESR